MIVGDHLFPAVASRMSFLMDRQQRAAFLIMVLGAALVFAVWPYFSGLLGAPVHRGDALMLLARADNTPGEWSALTSQRDAETAPQRAELRSQHSESSTQLCFLL